MLLAVLPHLVMADAPLLDLQTVLASATVTPPARVAFHEERHIPLLDAPLVLTGHLEYVEAGVLRKVVEAPFEQSFLVRDDRIVIERDGERHQLSLNASKSLRTILGAIEAILAGEADELEAVFNYQLSGAAKSWSVRLTPKSRRIAKQLTSFQVNGDDRSATSIRIDLVGGEWHQMDILREDTEQ